MSDASQLLEAASRGDRKAAAELLPLVYDELRKLAARHMAAESPDHTLDATALVHEAYLRLLGKQRFDGSGHFFAAAAESMRRILVDSARRKHAKKRNSTRRQVNFNEVPANSGTPDERLIALDEALTRFAVLEPVAARVVELRHFAGLSIEGAAEALGISRATAYRHWVYARAWLRDAL
jgi:RNA polymerase sigma factor (TIGR02999 family)